jgi:hypothetical protein
MSWCDSKLDCDGARGLAASQGIVRLSVQNRIRADRFANPAQGKSSREPQGTPRFHRCSMTQTPGRVSAQAFSPLGLNFHFSAAFKICFQVTSCPGR